MPGLVGGIIVIAVIVLVILASCIKIVPQAQAVVLERLGAYKETWNVGIHFEVPFIDKMARRVVLKEQVADFPPQPVITKDNVTMRIDTVIFFQITDPKLFAYGVENPIMAIENLTATTLRNIIGELAFDQTLTSREVINSKMRVSLDVATDPWGIKVNRVEVKNIIPPAAIQDAMEKQKRAELEKIEAEMKQWKQQDEDVLTYALFPQVAKEFFESRPAKKPPVEKREILKAAAPEVKKAPVSTEEMDGNGINTWAGRKSESYQI